MAAFTDQDPIAPLENLLNQAVASAVSSAATAVDLSRPIKTYKWVDAAAQGAQAGMTAGDEGYQIDTDTMYRYDGSGWAKAGSDSGLVRVIPTSVVGGTLTSATVAFTGASSVSLNGVFTTDFDNYEIVVDIPTQTAASVLFRLRNAGTDDSTASSYGSQNTQRFVTTNGTAPISDTAGRFTPASGTESSMTVKMFGPKLARTTRWVSDYVLYAGVLLSGDVGGRHTVSTAFDGLTFYPESGTMTGTITVYAKSK